ncbi:hypothetical protein KUV51_02835 [Tateyamaria omphalii]|uniref:hypothetical protein n=1 Tax=Tateyamaria omphalii TaxID=299262 RepID=UPI001C99B6FE|nr:hypothetical protein [Tateyamaria omphalii]MBY5931925.1 hypothetical protein [Tateyamaria omphalii]
MPSRTAPAIYCYSKSGNSRRVALALAEKTGADVISVDVDRYRSRFFWMVRAIWDVGRKNAPPLLTGNVLPAQRPWIVVAGPVWANQPAAPLRTVLETLTNVDVCVGVLLTCGRSKEQGASLTTCEDILGHPLAACVSIPNEMTDAEDVNALLSAFASALTGRAAKGAA